jgi:hypothetical protein
VPCSLQTQDMYCVTGALPRLLAATAAAAMATQAVRVAAAAVAQHQHWHHSSAMQRHADLRMIMLPHSMLRFIPETWAGHTVGLREPAWLECSSMVELHRSHCAKNVFLMRHDSRCCSDALQTSQQEGLKCPVTQRAAAGLRLL